MGNFWGWFASSMFVLLIYFAWFGGYEYYADKIRHMKIENKYLKFLVEVVKDA